ncbi:hypothetical protein [Streptomyces roseoverticillatus]|nr:hypothetical protein [Streptomyces roseoverticillatus]
MVQHRRPKAPVDWSLVRSVARTVTPWVELLTAVTALALAMTGRG